MSGSIQRVDATQVSTFWRAFNPETGEDYAGTAVAHNATGLRLGYYRPGAASAVEAVTGGSPAPASLAAVDAAHTPWGWRHIVGPFYRADFPDAAFVAGVPHIMRWVRGITGVVFVPATLEELTASDPRAASATEASIAAAVLTATQAEGVALTAAQVTALTRAVFRALHYADGFGVERPDDDASISLIVPGEPEPIPVPIDTDTGRPTVTKAGAGAM